jgi:hypothetical protein
MDRPRQGQQHGGGGASASAAAAAATRRGGAPAGPTVRFRTLTKNTVYDVFSEREGWTEANTNERVANGNESAEADGWDVFWADTVGAVQLCVCVYSCVSAVVVVRGVNCWRVCACAQFTRSLEAPWFQSTLAPVVK